jgi:poly-gamma-glutamate synthesis protein (capsule biosynthesis protein)
MAIEVHAGVPIIYGAGDLINDYEGIPGHEAYRPDLRLLYIIDFEDGRAVALHALGLQVRRFRLERADERDLDWLKGRLTDTARAPAFKLKESGLLTSAISR